MKFASLTQRLGSDSADAWHVHTLATKRKDAGEDIIMLSIGEESGVPASTEVTEAACNSLRSGRHHYSDVRGTESLRLKIAGYHEKLTGQKVGAQHCTVYAGAQNALFAVTQCLLESGDEVLLPEPYYTTYPAVFGSTGATLRKVSGSKERLYLASIEEIENKISDHTKVIVITQPGNPMGTWYNADEIAQLVELCRRHHIWLISDEVYSALLTDEQRTSPASLASADDLIITVNSLSKSHRMTGWRLGWAVTPADLAIHLAELNMAMSYGQPPFTMDAAEEALSDNGATASEIRDTMARRRAVCRESLGALEGVELLDGGAGMFIVIDVTGTGLDASEFAEQLLAKTAVSILPCTGFGSRCDTLVRIGLCVPEAQIAVACERIEEFCRQLQQ